jgi:methyl-accepting chemotaxis protein/methyl-accepting chemotaxis protein-1 (serine sensor receptor)
VGEAVTQMDQVTQQNAALVEEMAAAASSLSHQAQALVGAVAVFKLSTDQARASQGGTPAAHPSPVAAPASAARGGSAGSMAPKKTLALRAAPTGPAHKAPAAPTPAAPASQARKPVAAGAEDDWESF